MTEIYLVYIFIGILIVLVVIAIILNIHNYIKELEANEKYELDKYFRDDET